MIALIAAACLEAAAIEQAIKSTSEVPRLEEIERGVEAKSECEEAPRLFWLLGHTWLQLGQAIRAFNSFAQLDRWPAYQSWKYRATSWFFCGNEIEDAVPTRGSGTLVYCVTCAAYPVNADEVPRPEESALRPLREAIERDGRGRLIEGR